MDSLPLCINCMFALHHIHIGGLQVYIIVIVWNGRYADFVSDIMSLMQSLPSTHHHCKFDLHTICVDYTLLVLDKSRVKPEGEGITEIRAHKARVEASAFSVMLLPTGFRLQKI